MTRRGRSFPASALSGCSRPHRKPSADRRQRRSSLFSLPQVCGRCDGCAKDSTSPSPVLGRVRPVIASVWLRWRGGAACCRAGPDCALPHARWFEGSGGRDSRCIDQKHDRSLVVLSFVGGSALPMRNWQSESTGGLRGFVTAWTIPSPHFRTGAIRSDSRSTRSVRRGPPEQHEPRRRLIETFACCQARTTALPREGPALLALSGPSSPRRLLFPPLVAP